MTSPEPVPPQAITAAAVAIHDVECGDRCGGSALGHCTTLAKAALEAAAPYLAAGHEHTWVPCEQCKTPDGPCACAGGICCEAQRREIEEFNEGHARGVADEREACAQLAEQHHAHYGCYVGIDAGKGTVVTSGLRPFASLLRETRP